jgi:tetratricopeptide (TPR) repeat protein
MISIASRCVVLVLCATLLSVAAGAHAQVSSSSDTYRRVIEAALQEFNEGRFTEARALFLRAHALQPSARTLRGLGLIAFELRHYVEALQLLSEAQTDRRNPLTALQRHELNELSRQASVYVGRYHLEIAPHGASVTVDGLTPPSASDLVLDVGEHTLVVFATGHRPESRTLDVKGGEQQTLRLQLAPLASEPPAPIAAHVPRPFKPAPKLAVQDDSLPLFAQRSTWGWTSLSVGLLGLGGATVAWRLGEVAATHWNDDTRCLRDNLSRDQNCHSAAQTAKLARTWTTVGLLIAAAGGIAASVLLWPVSDEQAPSQTAARCSDGPGEIGIACSVRF